MNTLKDVVRSVNPYENGSFLSTFFHCYLNPIYAKGRKDDLTANDIFKISEKNSCNHVCKDFVKYWEEEKKQATFQGRKESFIRVLVQVMKYKWLLCVFGTLSFETFKMLQSYFLKKCLDVLSKEIENVDEALYWATGLIAAMILYWLCLHPSFYYLEIIGVNVKSTLFSFIYEKVLKIRCADLQKLSDGHVITMLGYDGNTIEEGIKFSSFILSGPIVTTICIGLLWNVVGASCLVGIGVIFLLMILQVWFGRWFAKLKVKALRLTDIRINQMTEIIGAMQLTKMYAWEESFSQRVNDTRKAETNEVKKSAIFRALNGALSTSIPVAAVFATFTTYYFLGNDVTVGKVYFSMSIFFILRFTMTYMTFVAVPLSMESYVSCKRIEKFLLMEEIKNQNWCKSSEKGNSPFIEFDNVVASYEKEGCSIENLNGISFNIDNKSSPMIIHGAVGSGKTSIILAALNELIIKSGQIKISGTISYLSQRPWIFSGTIKQNILFGEEYDEDRFQKILEACALQQDLNSFKKREFTNVGEKGESLSGGQKARIALARAVYRDADIYLLDDPLSAVDSKVGNVIFESCVKGLLKTKIVLLVTHQKQFNADAAQTLELKSEGAENQLNMKTLTKEALCEENKNIATVDDEDRNSKQKVKLDESQNSRCQDDDSAKIGTVNPKLYIRYLVDGIGLLPTTLLMFFLILTQALMTFTDYWIGEWAHIQDEKDLNMTSNTWFLFKKDSDENIYLFAGLTSGVIFIIALSSIYFFVSLVSCAYVLHNTMFARIMKAHMYFFTVNPVGQILNRFSGDMHYMDNELPWVMSDFLKIALQSVAIIVINCINVPYLTPFVAVIIFVLIHFRNYHMHTAKQIKNIEAEDRSPMFTHVSTTLLGLTTIRSFQLEKVIKEEFINCVDHQAESRIMFYKITRWFAQRIDGGVLIFSAACIFAPIIIAKHSDINVELVGVSFTYLLAMCGTFQWCVRQSAELDNLMTSVQRVYGYTKVETEDGLGKQVHKTDEYVGNICAKDASFSYHVSLPNTINNLSFTINATEKIGIVGRTGAGKSSLFAMLLRLGKNNGDIFIDNYDISKLSLKSLRSIISVIPQDPMMFSGSVRHNLDPFGEYSDEDIWSSLEEAQLKETVMNLNGKLDCEISSSGGNISVGERQLFCMTRAILRQTKILLVDEATSNTDQRTDDLIQQMIRTKFKDCTVLTIAHRLNTVMDSDKIMVMHDGRIVEFDTPENLLQIKNGYFQELVEQSGGTSIPANTNE